MSSSDTRRRKRKLRAEAARTTRGMSKPDAADLSSKEEVLRRLLFMVVDAAGGTVRVPDAFADRVMSVPMSLVVKKLPAAEGGGTLLRLEIRAAPADALQPVG